MKVAPNVPRVRVIVRGDVGDDVEAWGRALWRSGYLYHRPGSEFSEVMGQAKIAATAAFQKDRGFDVTGSVNGPTWDAMERTRAKQKPAEWAFDAKAIQLATTYAKAHPPLTAEEKQRQEIAQWWAWAIRERDRIAYSQSRPYQRIDAHTLPTWADCSSFLTMGYKAAGAPDPNRRGFDGLGYTGTLLDGGRSTVRSALKVGDAVFYGFTTRSRPGFPYGSPTHVAGVLRITSRGIVVASHGSGSGPVELPIDYRAINPRTPFRTFAVI